MYYFINDYSEGALPQVLDALTRTNLLSTSGYGTDEYCRAAATAIRARFGCPDADVHFLVGGTQTNTAAISAFLRPWEAVITAHTAHINAHETGAIEARGHKILTAETPDGKLTPEQIRQVVQAHQIGCEEHMVLPRMVYLSNATELGTVYTKAELTAISETCRALGLLLYLDGARLGAALTAQGSDLVPEDLPALCDAFYIGGTKNGLLFGEALVIVRDCCKPCFRHMVKQCGGMLAKGRLLGLQFSAMLENDLWLTAAAHANAMAQRLSAALSAAGIPLYVNSPTNQVFVVLPIAAAQALQAEFAFEFSAGYDQTHAVYRFVTSWATAQKAVDALIAALRELTQCR